MPNCGEPHFSNISTGSKTVEGRLATGKWLNYKIGDKIEFFNEQTSMSILCEIEDIYMRRTFADLFKEFGQELLPGVSDVNEAISTYRQFYSEADERKHGVIGYKIKVL